MLKSVYIKNFALIEELTFKPSNGFNVVTGETGAGKSIIFDALGLLLGKRSDGITLYNSAEKCIIEGVFRIDKRTYAHFFNNHNLDFEEETIIRREIGKSGRSRSFINDTPATLQVIKELGLNLVDIHSQHETIEIFKPLRLIQLLDLCASNEDILLSYNSEFALFQEQNKKLNQLKEQKKEAQEQQNYYEFLLQELHNFNPIEEDRSLEERLEKLSNAEEIKSLALDFVNQANQEDIGIASQIDVLDKTLHKLDGFFPNLKLSDRLTNIRIELKELTNDLEHSAEETLVSQEELNNLESRFKLFQDLLSKHNSRSYEELLERYTELESRVGTTKNLDSIINELEGELKTIMAKLEEMAEIISQRRKEITPSLESRIVNDLKNLEMPHVQIQFNLTNKDKLGTNGKDNLEVLFSANKNRVPQVLDKVASGGEMSRLALVLKTQQTKENNTLIFDEIDTGVSGKVAKNVGTLLAKLGKVQQVISITHSPQVASSGSAHFFVSKEVSDNQTTTKIEKLDQESQLQVIAEMLSGTDISEAALENAKILIKSSSV